MASGNGYLVSTTGQPNTGVMTLTGLPAPQNTSTKLLCKGIFDGTYQLIGTVATTSNVNVQYTIAPDYATTTQSNVWITATTLTGSAPLATVISEHAVAIRLNIQTASSNDSYGVAWFWSDKR